MEDDGMPLKTWKEPTDTRPRLRRRFWRRSSRGRRPSSVHSYKDRKALEYLAKIALKYKIDSSEFFNQIVEAWDHEESERKQMTIECRKKTEDSAIFLFTRSQEVVAQFPISTGILRGTNQLEDYMKDISAARDFQVAEPKVEDLKAGMKHINLSARMLEIPRPNRVYTRSGTAAYISNALIGDETGTIRMSLWNQQIHTVSEGDEINIENGSVASFRGELQLRIGRSGTLSTVR